MIYAANFKTNHTRKSTEFYVKELNEKLGAKNPEDKVLNILRTLNLYQNRFLGCYSSLRQ